MCSHLRKPCRRPCTRFIRKFASRDRPTTEPRSGPLPSRNLPIPWLTAAEEDGPDASALAYPPSNPRFGAQLGGASGSGVPPKAIGIGNQALRALSPGAALGQRSCFSQAVSARSPALLPVGVTRKAPLTAPESSILMQETADAATRARGIGGSPWAPTARGVAAASAATRAVDPRAGRLIENLLQPRLLPLVMAVAVVVMAARIVAGIVAALGRVGGLGGGRGLGRDGGLGRLRRQVAGGALQNLVELAPVEPDAAALRAIVDLDALALAHHQRDGAMGAGHGAGHSTLPRAFALSEEIGRGGSLAMRARTGGAGEMRRSLHIRGDSRRKLAIPGGLETFGAKASPLWKVEENIAKRRPEKGRNAPFPPIGPPPQPSTTFLHLAAKPFLKPPVREGGLGTRPGGRGRLAASAFFFAAEGFANRKNSLRSAGLRRGRCVRRANESGFKPAGSVNGLTCANAVVQPFLNPFPP